ncbi:MAG: hypothetical protein ACI9DQ_001341 [Glaciecola sp.]|jgi:hypothetical protein
MSSIIKLSVTAGLIGLTTIAGIKVIMPAYDQFKIKKWLTEPIFTGFEATQKVDEYLSKYEKFPDITTIKELGLSGRELASIAYLVPVANQDNPKTGELHVVLTDTDIDPRLINHKIIFIRGANHTWRCTMTIDVDLRPDTCLDDAPPQPVYAG